LPSSPAGHAQTRKKHISESDDSPQRSGEVVSFRYQQVLDVFVAGNLDLAVLGLVSIGDPKRPSALRFYVAGAKPIAILGAGALSAQLYAPNAALKVGANTQVTGSIVAASFEGTDGAVHYDRAVLPLPEPCTDAAQTPCERASDCAVGLGCVAGSCVPCARDEDCSAPEICGDALCQALMLKTP
jgi:hypothetical protein